MSKSVDKQRSYYDSSSNAYEGAHVIPGDEHFVALEYMAAIMSGLRVNSVLDVGAGTGRAARFLSARVEGLSRVEGVEPSAGLREQGLALGANIIDGTGESLPFDDSSFDVVLATGVLHHVADPEPVVSEMLRVARTAVFISDSNRFGQGGPRGRALKVLFHRLGFWPAFETLRTRGRGYMESEGDGIFYSYSIFDSRLQVEAWADRSFVIPTGALHAGARPWPLTASTHGLLVGVREPTTDWAEPLAAM